MDSADDIQEKCDRKIEMLTKRNLERKLDLQKDQESKKFENAENEKFDYFDKSFNERKREIEISFSNSKNVSAEELPNHFNNISKNILILQKYVAASNIFLRTYDIKIYQQTLQNLSNQLKDLEELLLPKKKFGFRNRKPKITNSDLKEEINSKTDEPDACLIPKNILDNCCNITNENNASINLDKEKIFKKDVNLTNLENCTVTIFGSPSTLHMNSLKNCYVFSGPVSTSIFADDCVNCTFVIACQQLRLHSSTNTNIYLHVTSRAIMEDCNQILVAPYNLQYERIEDDFNASGLDMTINNWSSIDDFNWLNLEKKSPHWDVIKDEDRMDNWNRNI